MNRKEFFVYLIWETDRLRFVIDVEQGGVINFVAQYETLLHGKWEAVVRYDFAHGYFHQDFMNPNGEQEKTPIDIQDRGQALTFAKDDLTANWQRYLEKYTNRMKP